MKKPLFLAALLLAAAAAHAQDKPVLNSAPPGLPPPPAAPVPEVAPQPGTPPRPPAPEMPSSRDARQAGATSGGIGSKLFLYTNLGLGYSGSGNVSQFSLSLAPAVGYRLTERVAVGPGISYAYTNFSFGNSGRPAITTSSFGVKAFGQVQVIDQFFVHAEYEVTRAELLETDLQGFYTGRTVRVRATTPLAGVGYRNQFSDRAAGDVLFLYNFASAFNSIYPNPVIRFCFLFNLGR